MTLTPCCTVIRWLVKRYYHISTISSRDFANYLLMVSSRSSKSRRRRRRRKRKEKRADVVFSFHDHHHHHHRQPSTA